MSNKQQPKQAAVTPAATNPLAQMVQPPVNKPAYTPPAECHKGNVFAFSYTLNGAKVEFYGGGTSRWSVHTPDMVLIALQSSDYGDVPAITLRGLSMPSLDKYRNVRIINIAIPDGHAPSFPLVFWEELLASLVDLARQEITQTLKVLVRCMGGHGRTGVVLCALAVAAKACPGVDPIAWLRSRYCKKAVESDEQFNYIERLSGVPSKEDLKPPFQGTAWGTQPTQPPLVGMQTAGKMSSTTTPGSEASTLTDDEIAELDESELESVIWNNDDSVWSYKLLDGSSILSSDDPTVFGMQVDGGILLDSYVNLIEYRDKIIRVTLSSGEVVSLIKTIGADGEPEVLIVSPENETSIAVKEQ